MNVPEKVAALESLLQRVQRNAAQPRARGARPLSPPAVSPLGAAAPAVASPSIERRGGPEAHAQPPAAARAPEPVRAPSPKPPVAAPKRPAFDESDFDLGLPLVHGDAPKPAAQPPARPASSATKPFEPAQPIAAAAKPAPAPSPTPPIVGRPALNLGPSIETPPVVEAKPLGRPALTAEPVKKRAGTLMGVGLDPLAMLGLPPAGAAPPEPKPEPAAPAGKPAFARTALMDPAVSFPLPAETPSPVVAAPPGVASPPPAAPGPETLRTSEPPGPAVVERPAVVEIASAPQPAPEPVAGRPAAEAVSLTSTLRAEQRPAAPRISEPPPSLPLDSRSSPAKVLALLGLVIVVVGGGVFLALRSTGVRDIVVPAPPTVAPAPLPPPAPTAAPAPTQTAAPAPTAAASGAEPAPAPTASATAAPTAEPAPTAQPSASAAPAAEAPAAPAASLTPPDTSQLAPRMGYLAIVFPGEASVYVRGVLAGKTNEYIQMGCGFKNVRIGKLVDPAAPPAAPTWLTEGTPIDVPCKGAAAVPMQPKP